MTLPTNNKLLSTMRKAWLFATTLFFFPLILTAGGGMWLPLLLENLNEEEMQAMGMKISAKDIYDINNGSLKDAIVHFGGFCTGEVISKQGLVLTNHHCGYGAIQSHTTLENNYLEDGFWAPNKTDEKPNPGLFVTFIDRIEDISRRVLAGVDEDTPEKERDKMVQANLEQVRAKYKLKDHEELIIKPFYAGNQYFAFVTKTYPDVRLVGAPPSSVGKYGADTDNWEWPRHTGDFSLFRIYTAPDGSPAEYAAENIPMVPKQHLEISTAGVKPGDFSMIFGFPGRTDQYLPASAMQQRTEVINPIRIGM
ncbi:MAG: S46 family peptidase, partial [Bacteroidota bacterium]